MRDIQGRIFPFELVVAPPNGSATLRCQSEDSTLQPLCDVAALAVADNPATLLRSLTARHGQAWLRGAAGYTFDRTDPDWPSETVTAFHPGGEVSVTERFFREWAQGRC